MGIKANHSWQKGNAKLQKKNKLKHKERIRKQENPHIKYIGITSTEGKFHSDKLDKILNVCQVMENRINRVEAHIGIKSDGRKKKDEENKKDGDSSLKDAGHSEEQTQLNKQAAGEKGEEKLQEDPTTKKAEENRKDGDSSLKDAGHNEEQPQQTTQDAGHQGDSSLQDAGHQGDPSLQDADQSEEQPKPTTQDAADQGEQKEEDETTQDEEKKRRRSFTERCWSQRRTTSANHIGCWTPRRRERRR